MAADLAQARAFLEALDVRAESWTFQTFGDAAKDKRLTRMLHGSLDTHGATLAQLNDCGAGVFVTVNQTDLAGRKKANIKRVRALFVDLDGAPIEPVQSAPTPPHIVVESSPGRYHAYWRVSDCALDACEPALKEIIGRFSGDPACSDRSRVLRLPGFLHQKHEPFMVRAISTTPGEYRLSEFGLTTTYRRVPKSSSEASVSSVGREVVRFLPESVGERNRCLFALARYLRGLLPTATRPELRKSVEQWHQLALPVIGTAGFAASWGDFLRSWESVQTPYGSVLNSILEKVEMSDEIPESIAALGYREKDYQLVRICRELQRHEGGAPFFLGARKAGELIGAHFTDASKMLHALVTDGVLELFKRGAGKVASRYLYIWPGEVAAAISDDRRRTRISKDLAAASLPERLPAGDGIDPALIGPPGAILQAWGASSSAELLSSWRERDAGTRQRFRRAGTRVSDGRRR